MSGRKSLPNATSTPSGVRVHLPKKSTSASEKANSSRNISGVFSMGEEAEHLVSQRNFDLYKDTMKSKIEAITREHNEQIDSLLIELKDLKEKVATMEDNFATKPKVVEKIPLIVSQHVRMAYRDSDIDNAWTFSEPFRSTRNAEVTRQLIVKVTEMKLDFDHHDIYRATRRHFDTLKRASKENPEMATVRRRTTRRHRLYDARDKVVQRIDDGEDRALWELMHPNTMSDQESEGEGVEKRIVFYRPHWRSQEANDLVERIDLELKNPRTYSTNFSHREVDLEKIDPSLIG